MFAFPTLCNLSMKSSLATPYSSHASPIPQSRPALRYLPKSSLSLLSRIPGLHSFLLDYMPGHSAKSLLHYERQLIIGILHWANIIPSSHSSTNIASMKMRSYQRQQKLHKQRKKKLIALKSAVKKLRFIKKSSHTQPNTSTVATAVNVDAELVHSVKQNIRFLQQQVLDERASRVQGDKLLHTLERSQMQLVEDTDICNMVSEQISSLDKIHNEMCLTNIECDSWKRLHIQLCIMDDEINEARLARKLVEAEVQTALSQREESGSTEAASDEQKHNEVDDIDDIDEYPVIDSVEDMARVVDKRGSKRHGVDDDDDDDDDDECSNS